jgi:hypothetical protein
LPANFQDVLSRVMYGFLIRAKGLITKSVIQ